MKRTTIHVLKVATPVHQILKVTICIALPQIMEGQYHGFVIMQVLEECLGSIRRFQTREITYQTLKTG